MNPPRISIALAPNDATTVAIAGQGGVRLPVWPEWRHHRYDKLPERTTTCQGEYQGTQAQGAEGDPQIGEPKREEEGNLG